MSHDYPPGIVDVNAVEPYQRSTSTHLKKILHFACENTDMNWDSVSNLFEHHFAESTLQCYQHVTTYNQRIIIEAFFDDENERDKILNESRKNGIIIDNHNRKIHVEVKEPVPHKQEYNVYTLDDLPLDSPKNAIEIIKNATKARLNECYRYYNTTTDVLAGFKSTESTGKQYYNCTASIILSRSISLYSNRYKHSITAYGTMYRLCEPGKYHCYCRHCRTLDFHNTENCSNPKDM